MRTSAFTFSDFLLFGYLKLKFVSNTFWTKKPKAIMTLANSIDKIDITQTFSSELSNLNNITPLYMSVQRLSSDDQIAKCHNFSAFIVGKSWCLKTLFSLLKKCLAFTRLLERLKIV